MNQALKMSAVRGQRGGLSNLCGSKREENQESELLLKS